VRPFNPKFKPFFKEDTQANQLSDSRSSGNERVSSPSRDDGNASDASGSSILNEISCQKFDQFDEDKDDFKPQRQSPSVNLDCFNQAPAAVKPFVFNKPFYPQQKQQIFQEFQEPVYH
jgi:hypothetical protein